MRLLDPDDGLAFLLAAYEKAGGVLHYVLVEVDTDLSGELLHRRAAVLGMAAIDVRIEEQFRSCAPNGQLSESRFRVLWDETKARGELIPFVEFWGTDDIEPQPISASASALPERDGYKPAFFHPPYPLGIGLTAAKALFKEINRLLLGEVPDQNEIYAWSTDWSNYFDDGLEWWGAFYWTIRPPGSQRLVVIGASATD